MSADLLLPLRRACVIHLRAYAPLITEVAPYRGNPGIFDEVPSDVLRPYVQYGAPISSPYAASGVTDGADVDLTLHVFDQAHDNDRLLRIMGLVEKGLDEAELDIQGAELLWLEATGALLAPEAAGTPQYRHGIVSFTCGIGKLES